jgi:DDE family transposase
MPARSLRGPDLDGEPARQSAEAMAPSLAYVLVTALRRMALQRTELAQANAGTIRLKLLKLGALVTVSVRRVKVAIASACPMKSAFANAYRQLRQPA